MNDLTVPDLTGMTGTMLITTIVFVLTDLMKSVIGINGNKTAVRYLALLIALAVSFGHRFLGAGEHFSWMRAWQALEQAVLSVGGALGIHVVRTDSNGLGGLIQGLRARGAEQQATDVAEALSQSNASFVESQNARIAEARKLLGLDNPQPEPPAQEPDVPVLPAQRPNPGLQIGSGLPVSLAPAEPQIQPDTQSTEQIAQLLMDKFNFAPAQAFSTALRKPEEARALLGMAGHLPATSPGQGQTGG